MFHRLSGLAGFQFIDFRSLVGKRLYLQIPFSAKDFPGYSGLLPLGDEALPSIEFLFSHLILL